MKVNIVTAAIALIAMFWYMGFYMARIPSAAFWVVTTVCLFLVARDFWSTLRSMRSRNGD